MSLTKEKCIDVIEVVENGILQVREAIKIIEDGNVLSASYNRFTLSPGDDITSQEPRVQAIANAVWTPEVISAYKAQQLETAPVEA